MSMSVCVYVCVSVCLYVCMSPWLPVFSRAHFKNTRPNFAKFLYTHCPWPRLELRYVIYFRFCRWRHMRVDSLQYKWNVPSPYYQFTMQREIPPQYFVRCSRGGGATCLCVCICLPVCLSASIISEESHVQLSPIFMQVASNRGSVLLWQRSDTLCTSGFVYAVSHVCVMARNRRRERSTPSYCVVFRIFV